MPDQDGRGPPPWPSVVRRSVGWGALAAALGVVWYFLSEPGQGVYALVLAALGVTLVLRTDGVSWGDDRRRFLREHGARLGIFAVMAVAAVWLLLGRPGPAAVGSTLWVAFFLLLAVDLVTDSLATASDEGEPEESPTGPQKAVAFVLFWAAFVAVVLLATWIGPWPLPFSR